MKAKKLIELAPSRETINKAIARTKPTPYGQPSGGFGGGNDGR